MNELLPIVLMTIFYLLAWMPSSMAKFQSKGWKWIAGNRMNQDFSELSKWGLRSINAHNNLKDYFPGFVLAICLIYALNKQTETTTMICWVYFVSRLGHFVFYCMGVPTMRALTYLVSMVANFYLLFSLL